MILDKHGRCMVLLTSSWMSTMKLVILVHTRFISQTQSGSALAHMNTPPRFQNNDLLAYSPSY